MATVVPPQGGFEIGRVFGRTFEVIGRNWLLYLALAVVLVGLPTLIFQLLIPTAGNQNALRDAILSGNMKYWLGVIALGGLIGTIFRYFLQATLVRATIEDLSDRRPNFGDCLVTGLKVVLPIIGIAIVTGAAVAFGLLLLIVPGVMLALAWSVAIPAKVAEQIGVFESLSRSAALTKGHRWQLFGLYLITFIVLAIVQGAVAGTAANFGIAVTAVVSAVVSAVASAVTATLVATIYVELRVAKEGANVQSLADVFS